jgi:polar amino acid transport system substrate-binding protein
MRLTSLLLVSAIAVLAAACAMTPDNAAIRQEIAPTGVLRMGVNFGNAVHTQPDPAGGAPRGAAPDLARELAKRIGVPIKYVTYDAAGKMAEGLKAGETDIVFLAIDPERANDIAFTRPYVQLEGTYLVRKDSRFNRVEDLDQDGVKIIVGTKSAYDLYLTPRIKRATIVRGPGGVGYLADWRKGGFDAAAGVRQALNAEARRDPAQKVLDGHFMTIPQAIGVPKARQNAARYIDAFVAEMIASGFVRRSLDASGNADATVPR